VPLPTAIAGGLLVLALVAASAFVALRGGIDLAAAPGGVASPSALTADATATPSPRPTSRATAARPSPVPTVSPALGTPAPTPVATPAATPVDPRYAGLKACPDRPDCYLYVVRRGDTLSSIAAFFGVSLRAVRDLNEEIENPSIIRVGQRIRVPGPG
jgi:nucleoid-associated protein YgaU